MSMANVSAIPVGREKSAACATMSVKSLIVPDAVDVSKERVSV